jgi:hypothetical protein
MMSLEDMKKSLWLGCVLSREGPRWGTLRSEEGSVPITQLRLIGRYRDMAVPAT